MSALLQIGLINAAVATVLACAAALVGRKVRQPALMHALWIIVLVKLVTPPVFEVPVQVPFSLARVSSAAARLSRRAPEHRAGVPVGSASAADSSHNRLLADNERSTQVGTASSRRSAEPAAAPNTISTVVAEFWNALAIASGWLLTNGVAVIGSFWLAGSVSWFLLQGYTAFKFSRRLALAIPASGELQRQADELARAMGLAYRPPVMIVRDVISPMLWGVGRNTRLLFPMNLLARLDPAARDTLIAHELAHFRRGDHWVRAFELFVSGIYWWNPVLWWARREIEIAEEECCDAWVIEQFPTIPRSYAEALLETIDFLSEAALVLPPAAVGAGHVPFLRRRLTAIMCGAAPKKMTLRAWLSVAVAGLGALPWHPGLTTGTTGSASASASTVSSRFVDADQLSLAATASESLRIASDLDRLIESWTAEMVGISPAPIPPLPADQEWATARSANGKYSIKRRGSDGISLHNAEKGEDIDLSDHHILTVAFSPDGKQFATGGADQTIRLWDSSTGVVLRTFPRHAGSVQSVGFINGGKELVSASRDGRLILWNIDPADEREKLPCRYTPITCMAVSPDGRWLAVGSGNWMSVDETHRGHIVVWDVQTLQEQADFECDLAVGAVSFKADSNTLVAGDFKGRVTFWNLAEQERIGTTLPRFKDAVAAARFSIDTHALAQVGLDDILVQPDFERTSSTPLTLYLDQPSGAGPFSNGTASKMFFDGIRHEPAATSGLRDLKFRIEALEQSVDEGDTERGTPVRPRT